MLAYELVDTALGRTLIAWTPRGIGAVLLGEQDEVLASDLVQRFPLQTCHPYPPTGASAEWVAHVMAVLNGDPSRAQHVPLDLQGTPFQIKVWQALRSTTLGQLQTYGALAKQLQQPSAARAVAKACAANHIAVLVPCHRVIRSDGQIAGYRWGEKRKRKLLARESVFFLSERCN